MIEWQEIETAPRDGRRFLAKDEERDYISVVVWDEPDVECLNMTGRRTGIGFYPTHWAELDVEPHYAHREGDE